MATLPGSRLGPYEILSAIGAGGMGEVYRARDPKLGRDVAIKVLPEAFARDAERMARFQREAKVLASLNHPNIATIYGLEDSGSTRALVMELVEGPTLADRIKVGAIPVGEAVHIARQIADALEYAHERGIIHRDLKPANVKVTNDDTVKVLDFGLAKAIEPTAVPAQSVHVSDLLHRMEKLLEGDTEGADIANSPTLSAKATRPGILLGTAAYMSPEQAKGKTVDRRADIWAFGCVFYEMMTGKVAFSGESVADTLAAILKNDPDWSQLPTATPVRVRVLLQRCLDKDPKQRLRDIGEARISLDEVVSGAPEQPVAAAAANSAQFWRRMALPWVLFGVTALAFATLALVHFHKLPQTSAALVQRFEIAAPDLSTVFAVALSPDGTRLVLQGAVGNPNRLWLRRIDSIDVRPLEGTEGASGIPFWSPDSRFIAFGTANGKLKKIDAEGGPAQVLCDSSEGVIGGFWTPDGKIIFGDPLRQPGLWEVPAEGGVSTPLSGVEHSGDPYRYGPALLPDGRHFLYSSGSAFSADVYLGSLDGKPGQQSSRKLLTGAFNNARYVPSQNDPNLGYLLFVRDGTTRTLVAQPFDLRKLELAGEPVPIAEQVAWWNFSASLSGTLVYVSGVSGATTGQLTLFDRQGKILGTAGEPGGYLDVALSPDGRRVVAVRRSPESSQNLWMVELARGISTRFTFGSGIDMAPVWSPDGSRVAFTSDRSGHYDLYQKLSNGGGEDEPLFKSDKTTVPHSWSGDGRFLLFEEGDIGDATEWVLPLDKDAHAAGRLFPFVQKGVGIGAKFSPGPGGHPLWVAYSSNESGKFEIYVRTFDPKSPIGTPPGGGKWQVSTDGGMSARWNGNGKELFYVAPDGTVMSVEVRGNATFQAGTPKPLFKPKGLITQPSDYFFWDASSDGKKFVFAVSSGSGGAPPPRFTVVLNWPSLLKK